MYFFFKMGALWRYRSEHHYRCRLKVILVQDVLYIGFLSVGAHCDGEFQGVDKLVKPFGGTAHIGSLVIPYAAFARILFVEGFKTPVKHLVTFRYVFIGSRKPLFDLTEPFEHIA